MDLSRAQADLFKVQNWHLGFRIGFRIGKYPGNMIRMDDTRYPDPIFKACWGVNI